MEWALRLSTIEELASLEEPFQSSAPESKAVRGLLFHSFKDILFTRLYYGSEFCENLLPSQEDLKRVKDLCAEKGLSLTLMTPPLADDGLNRIKAFIEPFVKEAPEAEVVVNDWGLFNLLRSSFAMKRLLLGRLMTHTLQEPRGYDSPPKNWSNGGEPSPFYDFVLSQGIIRVELDSLDQALSHKLNQSLRASLYIPYAMVTTGRICLTGSMKVSRMAKFLPQTPCSRECISQWAQLHSQSLSSKVFQRGKTIFTLYEPETFEDVLRKTHEVGIQRIVYEPYPPL